MKTVPISVRKRLVFEASYGLCRAALFDCMGVTKSDNLTSEVETEIASGIPMQYTVAVAGTATPTHPRHRSHRPISGCAPGVPAAAITLTEVGRQSTAPTPALTDDTSGRKSHGCRERVGEGRPAACQSRRERRAQGTPSQDLVFRLLRVGASDAASHCVLPSNAIFHWSNRFSVSVVSHSVLNFSPFLGTATWNKSAAPTPSQGCSSGSGLYTPSVKATLQRAELLVVDRKLGRDPITDPC